MLESVSLWAGRQESCRILTKLKCIGILVGKFPPCQKSCPQRCRSGLFLADQSKTGKVMENNKGKGKGKSTAEEDLREAYNATYRALIAVIQAWFSVSRVVGTENQVIGEISGKGYGKTGRDHSFSC